MTIADELMAYVNGLQVWAQNAGASVALVANLRLFWQQAATRSDQPRVLFCFEKEIARGPFSRAAATHRVDRQFKCAVMRGRGYPANRGDTLTTTVGNADPFLDQVEYIRDYIRAVTNTSVETPLDYKSMSSFEFSRQLVMDGYLLDFSTAHDLSALTTTSNNPPT